MTTSRLLSSFLPALSWSTTAIPEDSKNEIKDNLAKINIDPAKTDKYLEAISDQPLLLKLLAMLTQPTKPSRQSEPYYLHNDCTAEFNCTWSNIGFLAVALYYQRLDVLTVGMFSALSHAIPFESLNVLDRIAATAISLSIIINYPVIVENPAIVLAGLTTLALGGLDFHIGRPQLATFNGLFHSGWHLAAALTMSEYFKTETNMIPTGLNP